MLSLERVTISHQSLKPAEEEQQEQEDQESNDQTPGSRQC